MRPVTPFMKMPIGCCFMGEIALQDRSRKVSHRPGHCPADQSFPIVVVPYSFRSAVISSLVFFITYMNLRSLFSLFSSDLAIDLGTANTLVFAKGKGIVVNEPSIVALNKTNGEVEAVGKEAKEMLGRTPGNIVAIKPMKDGVIADFRVTEKMLNYFIHKAHNRKMLVHPRIVIGVPSEITQVEKRAVMDSAYRAKASEVHLVEQAMVAAIGAGLPITEPSGNMVVDIGGGTTDVAVMQYLKRKYNLLIGERTAEAIKIEVGSAYPLDKPLTMEIKGRNLIEGVPRTISIDDSEIRAALSE